MRDQDGPLLVKVPEAARLLGISTGLAYQMARDGRLPAAVLTRRAVRVRRDRLMEWIERHTREDVAPVGGSED